MKGRLEDRLHYLEHGLLNPPINHVRDAQTALASAWLGNPNPADLARLVCPVQQRTVQPRQKSLPADASGVAPGDGVSWSFGPASGTLQTDTTGCITIPRLTITAEPARLSVTKAK